MKDEMKAPRQPACSRTLSESLILLMNLCYSFTLRACSLCHLGSPFH